MLSPSLPCTSTDLLVELVHVNISDVQYSYGAIQLLIGPAMSPHRGRPWPCSRKWRVVMVMPRVCFIVLWKALIELETDV